MVAIPSRSSNLGSGSLLSVETSSKFSKILSRTPLLIQAENSKSVGEEQYKAEPFTAPSLSAPYPNPGGSRVAQSSADYFGPSPREPSLSAAGTAMA